MCYWWQMLRGAKQSWKKKSFPPVFMSASLSQSNTQIRPDIKVRERKNSFYIYIHIPTREHNNKISKKKKLYLRKGYNRTLCAAVSEVGERRRHGFLGSRQKMTLSMTSAVSITFLVWQYFFQFPDGIWLAKPSAETQALLGLPLCRTTFVFSPPRADPVRPSVSHCLSAQSVGVREKSSERLLQ